MLNLSICSKRSSDLFTNENFPLFKDLKMIQKLVHLNGPVYSFEIKYSNQIFQGCFYCELNNFEQLIVYFYHLRLLCEDFNDISDS
jgi:hypothetical protein